MFNRLKEDIAAVRERDPAARSVFEIYLLYPGLKAVRMHRRAAWCLRHKLYFCARWISQRAVRKTGIEIHPGATIGRRLFIDHGSGVVIGETAEIGDDVTIGSGAKVLGPFRVGDNTKIAAGSVVLREIPPNCTAVGVPARVVKLNGRRVDPLDHADAPDPVAQEICQLRRRLHRLEREIELSIPETHEGGAGI